MSSSCWYRHFSRDSSHDQQTTTLTFIAHNMLNPLHDIYNKQEEELNNHDEKAAGHFRNNVADLRSWRQAGGWPFQGEEASLHSGGICCSSSFVSHVFFLLLSVREIVA